MDPVHSGFKEGMQTSVYAKKNTEWNQSSGTTSASQTFHCSACEVFFLLCSAHTKKHFDQDGAREELSVKHNIIAANQKLDCGMPV